MKEYDHLGTLSQTYKEDLNGIIPTSMQTHNPYGGDRWTNVNLTETESTLLNWVGKEKDNESKLGDHGVRKYEYETGRFISIDPLWAKYYGWTPFQYSMNSPIMNVDYSGLIVEFHTDYDYNTILLDIESSYRKYVTKSGNRIEITMSEEQFQKLEAEKEGFDKTDFYKLVKMVKSPEVFYVRGVEHDEPAIMYNYSPTFREDGTYYSNDLYEPFSLKRLQEESPLYMTLFKGIFLGKEPRKIENENGSWQWSEFSKVGKNEIFYTKGKDRVNILHHEMFLGHAWLYYLGQDHGETNMNRVNKK